MNDNNWRADFNDILDQEKERAAAIVKHIAAEEAAKTATRRKNLRDILHNVGIPVANDADYNNGYFSIDGYRFYGSFAGKEEQIITVIISADTEDKAINDATKGSLSSGVHRHSGLPTLITGIRLKKVKLAFAQRLDSIDRKVQQLLEQTDE